MTFDSGVPVAGRGSADTTSEVSPASPKLQSQSDPPKIKYNATTNPEPTAGLSPENKSLFRTPIVRVSASINTVPLERLYAVKQNDDLGTKHAPIYLYLFVNV